jgi:hypothetical protein
VTAVPDSAASFEKLVKALARTSGAEQPRRKGFGNDALWAGKKMFAFMDSRGDLVLKLPAERVDALVEGKVAVRWDPGMGRLMREWAAIRVSRESSWLPLAKEAREFVSGMAGARKPGKARPRRK